MNYFNCKNTLTFLSNSTDRLSGENFEIYRCYYCNIDSPYPRPSNVDKYYPENYRDYNKLIEITFDFVYGLKAKFLRKFLEKKNKILEIVCGNGLLLKKLSELGFNTCGIEREDTVKNLENKYLKITSKDISEFEDNEFDMIILHYSFEHISNPFEIQKNFKKKLNNKGLLVVSIPVTSSIQYKYGKGEWFHLDVPRHFQIFDDIFLRKHLEIDNVELILEKPTGFFFELYGWFQTFNNKFFNNQNKFHKSLYDFKNNKFFFILGIFQLVILIVPSIFFTFLAFILKKTSTKIFILKRKF